MALNNKIVLVSSILLAAVFLDVVSAGHKDANGTACIVKGSYCSCHYCKCEKGHVHCGYGKHGYGKNSISILSSSLVLS